MLKILKIYIAYIVYFIRYKGENTKNIWLFGGHNGVLYDDNSKVFYEYLLDNKLNIEAYWIVDSKSKIKDKIKGKYLEKDTLKSYVYFFRSKVCVFSHSISGDIARYIHLVPFVKKEYKKIKKIYVSHGIEGMKKIKNYKNGKNKTQLSNSMISSYDLIISANQFDKNIKINDWKINKNKIKVIGMPRFDKLEDKQDINNKSILYIPTWREWIYFNENDFENSQYYKKINSLLKNEKLIKIIEKEKIILKIYLHHYMHKYIKQFSKEKFSKNIKILSQEVNVQNELITNSLMITDYSSVAYDFFYQNKPIIFYQFDLEEYLEKRGSYINLKKDLFGEKSYDEIDCVNKIEKYINNNFKLENIFLKNKKKYFEYFDNKNCERLLETIINMNLINKENIIE